MLPRANNRRGALKGQGGQNTRTHMFFRGQADRNPIKRRRRTHNKFQSQQHSLKKVDEMVQTQDEIDPTQWTGNQRVLHFGPMAQRDPYFYYYPKGWDVLYPAHFGFFPYRTNKFRGSTGLICVWSFGAFLLIGGVMMTTMAYFSDYILYDDFDVMRISDKAITIHETVPAQIAGPILIGVGVFFLLLGIAYLFATSQMLNEKLRHHYHRDQAPTVRVYTTHYTQPRLFYETHPSQRLPPPASNVIENPNAHTDLLNPSAELKLFPPIVYGQSTLSLHSQHQQLSRNSSMFLASPYNTLRAGTQQPYSLNATTNKADKERQSVGGFSTGTMQPHHRGSTAPAGRLSTTAATSGVSASKLSRNMSLIMVSGDENAQQMYLPKGEKRMSKASFSVNSPSAAFDISSSDEE